METNSLPQETKPRRHRPYTPEQVTAYLEAQPRRGLTIAAFCQQHGIHPSVFHGWPRGTAPGTPLRMEQLLALIQGLETHSRRGWYRL